MAVQLVRRSFLLVVLVVFFDWAHAQETFYDSLSECAIALTKQRVIYDPSYFAIDYPNGDVPADRGVCTDVVIRAYRRMDIDLQKEIHEDMRRNFNVYPKLWGLSKPDPNIDHRRVPNLMTYFSRFGTEKEISPDPKDYLPGDIVCWNLGGSITHIGIVVKQRSADDERHMVVHNIGQGQVVEDCLFSYKIIGHYRYRKTPDRWSINDLRNLSDSSLPHYAIHPRKE